MVCLISGADPNMLNEKKQTIIHLATELNKVKTLEILKLHKEKIFVDVEGEHGRTALHIAAIYDHDECARLLVNYRMHPTNGTSYYWNVFIP